MGREALHEKWRIKHSNANNLNTRTGDADFPTGGDTALIADATFTGTWERNDYPDVMVTCKADVAGTLYFDFSDDNGTTVSTFPVSGFTAAAGIYEFHTAVKGMRWFRVRLVNGSAGQTTCALNTYFGTFRQGNLTLNQSISDDADSIVVRSVGVAQNAIGEYTNSKNDGLGFSTSDVLANGATYDSTVLSLVGYTQVQTDILSDVNGTIVIDFIRDSAGTDILRTLTIPYLSTDGYQFFSAPAFTPYVRYRFTADEAGQADFYFDTKFLTKSLSGQLLGLDSFISSSMVAPINRAITTGQDQAGVYRNISVVNQDDKTSLYTIDGLSNTQTVHLDASLASSTTTAYMLVDLSDTTNWKHTNTGKIILKYLVVEIDPGTTFSGQVAFCYLKNVDATNGDCVDVFNVDMRRSANLLVENINFGSHGFQCSDTYHFGATDADNVLYQTDVNLQGPDGNTSYPSGDGDLILVISGADTGNGAVNVSVTIGYETVE
jgi:hypothetical protein